VAEVKKSANKKDGARDFAAYFAAVYGERWPALRAALEDEPRKTTLSNPFGLQDYALDEASLYPVKHLDLQPGQRIADLCASPGGKSLAGIFALKGEGQWFCNDLSPVRTTRLRAVLFDCVPSEVMARVHVSRSDASRWGIRGQRAELAAFDRVLVDAPCSGERHLLAAPMELARWSAKSSRRLSVRQHALLCSGFDCLRVGGRIVYSTCSISPGENDGVVEKLLKSRAGRARVIMVDERAGEPTAYGHIFLPDVAGSGPIYFSVIEKIEE
jgi:16S rRNA C967 or C1407 C5-methylase (RsmB/RsmF family)